MNIVLPIVFAAAILGLFVKRLTVYHWVGLACFISLIIGYHFFKHGI